jgi:AraC-like DNA-binding protein/uncharacterized membrane protein YhaH (DUF805 family)
MYQHQGLNDVFFLMLYGAAAMFALVACCYLLFRRVNVIADSVASPVGLRRWAAAFLAAVAASHVWWALLGTVWLADDRLVRNLVGILLDRLTFVPLIMVVLVRMLQDRRRSLWPILLAMVPVAAIIIAGLVTHDAETETYNRYYTLVLIVSFVVYMIFAVRRYSLWLRDNYADLEHKEVWQSLLGLLCLILAFATYIVNMGSQFMEYLVQVETLFIVGFVTWRVDTIQQLSVGDLEFGPVRCGAGGQGLTSGGKDDAFIRSRLQEYCETTKLYLQHDLSLAQLSQSAGVDRADLSRYFARQGFTYNAYINRLRIDHFALLYREAVARQRPVTAQQLAFQCGFSSYSTFGVAFKQFMGQTAKSWMNNVQ